MKNSIFIAGGTGLVGSNLALLLQKKKIKFSASYFKTKPPASLKKKYKKYNFLKLSDCIKSTKNKKIVFICAVIGSNVKGMKNDPMKNTNENLIIRINLFRACCINKVKKIIWVSSSTLYQKFEKPIKEEKLDLNLSPHDIYRITGSVYRYIESLVEYFRVMHKMNITVIRTTSIYGPFDNFDPKFSHVIPGLIKKFYISKKITVWGNKRIIRDFVYVKDLVKVMLLASNFKKGLTFNFSSGKGTSIFKLVKTLKKILNSKKKIIFPNNNLSSVKYRVLSNLKINKLLKIKRTNLEDGLEETIEWYKKNHSFDE